MSGTVETHSPKDVNSEKSQSAHSVDGNENTKKINSIIPSKWGRRLFSAMKKGNSSEESSTSTQNGGPSLHAEAIKAKGTETQIEVLNTLTQSSDVKMKRLLHALDVAKKELLMEIEFSQDAAGQLERRSLFSRKILGKPKFRITGPKKRSGPKPVKVSHLNSEHQLTNAIIEIKEKHKEVDTLNNLIADLRQQKHSIVESKRQLDIIVTKQNEHINSLLQEDEKNKEQITALTAHSSTLLQRLIFEQNHVGALLRANKEFQLRVEALNEQIHSLKSKLEQKDKCVENHFKECATMTGNPFGDGNSTPIPKGKLRADLNGSRVKSTADKKVYLILEGRRCWVQNLNNLFRSGNTIHRCTPADIDNIVEGPALSYNAKLIQVGGDTPVYLFSNGVRRWVWSHSIMEKCNFNWEKIEKISEGEMAKIPLGETIGNSNVL